MILQPLVRYTAHISVQKENQNRIRDEERRRRDRRWVRGWGGGGWDGEGGADSCCNNTEPLYYTAATGDLTLRACRLGRGMRWEERGGGGGGGRVLTAEGG